MSTSEGS